MRVAGAANTAFLQKESGSLAELPGNFPHASDVRRQPAVIKIWGVGAPMESHRPVRAWVDLEVEKYEGLREVKNTLHHFVKLVCEGYVEALGNWAALKTNKQPAIQFQTKWLNKLVPKAARHMESHDNTTKCKKVILGIQQLHINICKLNLMLDWYVNLFVFPKWWKPKEQLNIF